MGQNTLVLKKYGQLEWTKIVIKNETFKSHYLYMNTENCNFGTIGANSCFGNNEANSFFSLC